MIVAIADDFSGASEIAGIGWRYGLSTEVQLTFDIKSNADLVVIDADTRSQNRAEAINRTKALAEKLKTSVGEVTLFKKVDSVFRGHIVDEINALHKAFHFERVLLLPANPARGRKIISGEYFVNSIPLDQTVFANDPHFPAHSSSVEKIISGKETILPHVHLAQTDKLPIGKLITGDTESKKDIKNYINQTTGNDLCCGGAECFEAYLEKRGYADKNSIGKRNFLWPPYTLIISGSTVKDQFNRDDLKENFFPSLSLPGQWQGEGFILQSEEEAAWHAEVLHSLKENKVVAIPIDHEIKRIKGPENFSTYFTTLVNFISQKIGRQNLHLAITGGATASDIIKNEALSFEVKQEIAPGIVTLVNKSKELFTVKPGSYLWPSEFIKSLINNNEEQTYIRN